MTKQKPTLWILLIGLALLVGLGLRLFMATEIVAPTHDGGISHLAATCNQGEFHDARAAGAAPFESWAPTSAFRPFFEVREPGCLDQIETDLVRHDIHPPLYFGLLHAAMSILGADVFAGVVLNALFFLLAALLLIFLCASVGFSRIQTLVAVAVFALSPATLATTTIMRQYELFGLCAFALGVLLVRHGLGVRVRPWHMGLVALATAAGCLTHYQFALVLASAGAYLVWRGFLSRRIDRPIWLGIAMVAGVLLALVLMPEGFLEAFDRQQSQADPFTLEGVATRVARVLVALVSFVVPVQSDTVAGTGIVTTALVIGSSWICWKKKTLLNRGSLRELFSPIDPLFFAVANWGLVVLAYLTFISPQGAMYAPYLAIVWPFLALAPAYLLGLFSRPKRAAIAFAGFMLLMGMWWTAVEVTRQSVDQRAEEALAQYSHIVVDNPRRGVLPRVYWLLPEDAMVFIASQDALIERCEDVLPENVSRLIWLSKNTYGNTSQKRTEFEARCGDGWSTAPWDHSSRIFEGFVWIRD